MTPRPRPAITENNTTQPPNTKGNHETEGDTVVVDDKAITFWDVPCAAMPPTSPGDYRGHRQLPRSEPYPTKDARRDDRAYHLARVCARFPHTISTESAARLARLLRPADHHPEEGLNRGPLPDGV
jgi:hypothetical protein